MNNYIVVGRLTADVKFTNLKDGTGMARFTVACNRDKNNTDFIPVTAFGKTAEFITNYFKKGSLIGLLCFLEFKYDKEKDVNYTNVLVKDVKFI